MKLTILGSCNVINWPEQLNLYFKDGKAIDLRNGTLMEMDALSIYHIAKALEQDSIAQQAVKSVLANLEECSFWKHGVWGKDEIHFRFTSSAIRLLLLSHQNNDGLITKSKLQELLAIHASYHEKLPSGVWFYHDSLESDDIEYYPKWNGVSFLEASNKNKLIINTQLDTLVTLLMARKQLGFSEEQDQLNQQAIETLLAYRQGSVTLNGVVAWLDETVRAIYLMLLQRDSNLIAYSMRLIKKFYFKRFRFRIKKKFNLWGFKSGYIERDIRLPGDSPEYHVVNIWDMCKYLLWLKVSEIKENSSISQLENYFLKDIELGLRYIAKSYFYKNYIKRLSKSTGHSNEILESIAIALKLGIRHAWLIDLYCELRKVAPPSAGVLGVDPIISGSNTNDFSFIKENTSKDTIKFYDGTELIINFSHQTVSHDKKSLFLSWSSSPIKGGEILEVKARSAIILS